MQQIPNYSDQRQRMFCAYCGGRTGTKDHVPSKILLDEPYPANLPVVSACAPCNQGFANDEEYLACLIDAALTGSTDANLTSRLKVSRALQHSPALASRLSNAREIDDTGTSFRVELGRVENIVLKLARGHAAFELNEPQLDLASHVAFAPLPLLAVGARAEFEREPRSSIFPEVGSRAMHRLVVDDPESSMWVEVQSGRYRYLTSAGNSILVRGVMSEYLGYEVIWGGQ